MKKPNITPGPWKTSAKFPGSIIAGEVEESHRGNTAFVVARIMGNVLPTYQANARAIAAVPDILAALENLYRLAAIQLNQGANMDGLTNCEALAAARQALTKAGYTF